MKPISYSLKDVLVRQGIANAQPVGASRVRGMKMRGAASDGAHSRVAAGEDSADLNSGKGRGPKPAPVHNREKRQRGQDGGTHHANLATLRLIVNPSMSGMPMRQTTQTPRAVAPRGVVSLMVIEGGKA